MAVQALLINHNSGNGASNIWIGLSDTITEKHYVWVDETSLKYSNWDDGEPSSNDGWTSEDCVEMYNNGRWNDKGCNTKLNFVCSQISPTSQPTPAQTPPPTPSHIIIVPQYFMGPTNEKLTWVAANKRCAQLHPGVLV